MILGTGECGLGLMGFRVRGATEGGQGTKQSTPTEALDPLDQPTPNQHTLLSSGRMPKFLEPKELPGALTLQLSTPTLFYNTNCSSALPLS